jgi:hypothetical protein
MYATTTLVYCSIVGPSGAQKKAVLRAVLERAVPVANAVMMPMHIPLPKASAGSWLSTARQPGITVFALCRVSSSA